MRRDSDIRGRDPGFHKPRGEESRAGRERLVVSVYEAQGEATGRLKVGTQRRLNPCSKSTFTSKGRALTPTLMPLVGPMDLVLPALQASAFSY